MLVTDYPLVVFDPPVPLPKLDRWHWRHRFRCPDPVCAHERARTGQRGRRVIGWQQIRKWTHTAGSVTSGAPSVAPVSGYLIEKVWLAQGLTDLSDLSDGMPSFGVPEGARDDPNTSSRARAVPVLASGGPTPFGPRGGDPYWVSRRDPGRVRGGTGYWVLALAYPKASRPFVVTCPDCGRRCRVDSALPEDELRRLDEPSA
ncbi:MAG: hypothetical protein ACHQ01_04565 [Candidatus Limnocylindrales bacterium]